MPFTNLKTTLGLFAALIMFLGFAGMISSHEPVVPIAQPGFSKGFSEAAVEPPQKKKLSLIHI